MQVSRGRGDSRYKSLRHSIPDILKEQQGQYGWKGLSKGSEKEMQLAGVPLWRV